MQAGIDYTGVTVAFFCHDEQGLYLMQKRSQHCRDERGRWEFGGGRLEFGESLEEGLHRELGEEYGCTGTIEQQLPAISHMRSDTDVTTHWITIPYIVRIKHAEAFINEPKSIDEIGWFAINKLPTPLHTACKCELEEFGEYFGL